MERTDFMELKKSYKGFVIWLVFFCLTMIPVVFVDHVTLSIRLCVNICLLDILILLYMIYKTENVYWYSGIDYEDAVSAGSERRKLYAKKHVTSFLFLTVLFVVYSLLAQFFNINWWIDCIVFMGALIFTVISTARFHL